MTAGELLKNLDSVKTNELCDDLKFRWINDVEGRVLCEIHKISPDRVKEIVSETDELTVPEPYSNLYILYLAAMIEFAGGNYSAYTELSAEFEKALLIYAKWFIRNR